MILFGNGSKTLFNNRIEKKGYVSIKCTLIRKSSMESYDSFSETREPIFSEGNVQYRDKI